MQGMFRLPWCTEQPAPKLSEKMSFETLRASPMMELPGLAKLKRKRVTSPESIGMARTNSAKKQRPDQAPTHLSPRPDRESVLSMPSANIGTLNRPHTTGVAALETPPHTLVDSFTDIAVSSAQLGQIQPKSEPRAPEAAIPQTTSHSSPDLSSLQQVIENEFNMQILFKHNELRLVEQELAKCQVALEQLRRCEIKPYPGSEGPSLKVTAGTGPAITPPEGFTRPSHPSPYGVMDGPYSRHYRQWLLPDTQFDAVPVSVALQMEHAANMQARSTRNSGSLRKPLSKSFSFASGRETLPAMSNFAAPAPRDKSTPLVLRRSTDGQLVKLICNNCLRGNFSSIQGFLNHCRIAHKVDYKSHDAAAIDCGRVLDEAEAANVSVETTNVPAPKPAPTSRTQITNGTPAKNLVHPMNVPGQTRDSAVPSSRPSTTPRKPVQSSTTAPAALAPQISSSFRPSEQAPRLSAHFAKFKIGGDLQEAIASARQRIDITHGEDDFDLSESSTPVSPSRPLLGVSHPLGRPVSRKGHREPMQRPRPSPLMPVARDLDSDMLDSPMDHTPNLSPHASDSNPGMVSDHEDDDHGSGSEDEAPQSTGLGLALPVRRDCSDHVDLDVIVEDGIDEHGVVIRRNSMSFTEDTSIRSAAGSPSRPHIVSKQHGR